MPRSVIGDSVSSARNGSNGSGIPCASQLHPALLPRVVPSDGPERSPEPNTPVLKERSGGPLPILVDIETAASAFGISVRQMRRFVAEGQIPYVRVGHLIRFDPDELNEWLDARRAGSTT
jgi:excisionase family DNA binding protein